MPRGYASVVWAVALALFCLLCPPVFAESDRAHLSRDPRVNQARALLDTGRHQAALDILRPLANPGRADITDIRFLIGLAGMGAAKQRTDPQHKTALLREAIIALHAILIDRPQLTRVRLELARAFFLNGDYDLSRTHFERIIAGNPSAAVHANIQRFLSAIRARRRWSGYFSFNIEQNDNLNSGTETEVIYLFGLPFLLNQDSRPRSGTGLAFAAGREYQHPLGKNLRWRFGVDATRSEYPGSESDQTTLSLRSGPRWLLSRRSDASVQSFVGQRWLSNSRYSEEYGLRFTARHQLTRQLGVNGRASWKNTHYQFTTTADDINTEYTLNGTYLFSPLVQGSAGIGLSHNRTKPKRPNSGSRSRRFNLGLSMILPRGWTVGTSLQWSRQRHNAQRLCATPACPSQRRLDRNQEIRLFFLNRRLTLAGFSPQLIVTQGKQRSNSVLHIYQRTRADLRFVRQF